MNSQQPVREIQNRIEKWLTEEGLTYRQHTGEQAHNTLFNYVVTLPSRTHVNIIQLANKRDSIVVVSKLLFTEEQMTRFQRKTQIERNEILSEMRFKLASIDVEFAFEDGQNPRAIRFDHPIYYDALTKDRFFKAITTVFKAFKIAGWAFTQAL